jgi:hypothetical protein
MMTLQELEQACRPEDLLRPEAYCSEPTPDEHMLRHVLITAIPEAVKALQEFVELYRAGVETAERATIAAETAIDMQKVALAAAIGDFEPKSGGAQG